MATLSVIGPTTVVRGGVRGEGDVEILGRVEGSIVIEGEVTIGEGALIQSDVRARRVIVRGAVRGNVSADELLILEPGARVLGDLGAPQVGIRPGGLVKGHVSTAGPLPLERPKPAAAAKAAPAPARAAPTASRAASAPAYAASRPAATHAASSHAAPSHAASSHAAPSHAASSHSAVHAPAHVPAPRPSPARVAPPAHNLDVEPATLPRAAPSRGASAAIAPPPPSSPTMDSEPADLASPAGEPPPPVVPALPKGARASMRKKAGGK